MADATGRTAVIPYCPREQFRAFHERSERWSCLIAHRRAGKTVACINDLIRAAITCALPDGRFSYVAPTYTQAKDIAWTYLKRYAEPILGETPNESELRVDLLNGSRIRLYGADNADRLRGIYNDGVVLDEFPLMRPTVWGEVLRPTLSDRGGWATFIGTPQGRAGLYDLWKGQGLWKDVKLFRLMLKASETGILSESELEDAKRTMTPEQYAQEYECSFEAAIIGAVYGKLIKQAEDDKRVCGVPYDPSALVHTAWDLGIGDSTAIWFAQQVGREIRIIDYYEASGADAAHYAGVLRDKPYRYGSHILPHDAEPKQLTSGKSMKETIEGLGIRETVVLGPERVEQGINAARLMLPMCWFDAHKCERGLEALRLYRYEWDDKLAMLKTRPVHDWTSHAADALRYLALGLNLAAPERAQRIVFPKHGVA
jgi:phage terminase large subunit